MHSKSRARGGLHDRDRAERLSSFVLESIDDVAGAVPWIKKDDDWTSLRVT